MANSKKDELTEEERRERGWDEAYNLTVWEEHSGQPTVSSVLLQNVTGGRLGITGTGRTKQSIAEAKNMRKSFRIHSSANLQALVDDDEDDVGAKEEEKKE